MSLTVELVQASETKLAPASHRIRDPDPDRVRNIAPSFKGGSQQIYPFYAYRFGDKWNIFEGCNSYLAVMEAFSGEPPFPLAIVPFETKDAEELMDISAKANNHEPLTMAQWKGRFDQKKKRGWSERDMAVFYGLSAGYVHQCTDPTKYGPEAQANGRLVTKHPPSENSSQNLHHVDHEFTTPLDPTLDPEISAETDATPGPDATRKPHPIPPAPALADSNGAMGAGQREDRSRSGLATKHPIQNPAPSPSFLSLTELRGDIGSVSKSLSRRTYLGLRPEDRPAWLIDLEAMAYRTIDFVASSKTGKWNGDEPVAIKGNIEAMRAKVRIDGKTFVLPLVEKTSSGWRVAGRDGILFIRRQDCLVIEPVRAGKVSA